MTARKKITTIGIDVFVNQEKIPAPPETLHGLKLKLISNRGTKVWPGSVPQIHLTDVYCCRYMADAPIESAIVLKALSDLESKGFHWVHIEKLIQLDGKNAFSDAQGE
jgi:hypothetical protein